MSTISASTTSTTAYKVTADTTGSLVLQTGSGPTTAVTFDANQNMGLGVTPSAWSGVKAIEIASAGSGIYSFGATDVRVTGNAYWNGSAYKYGNTNLASMYVQNSGIHYWYNAPSGTAGGTITFTQAMTLDASGKLLVGWTTAPTASASVIANGIQCTNTSGGGGYLMLGTSGGGQQFYTHTGVSGSESYTERMRLDSSGNLLVGLTSNTATFSSRLVLSYNSGTTQWGVGPWVNQPTNFYISANGGAQGVYLNGAAATSWTAWSDERVKTDLQPIQNAAQKVCSLRAVTGRYIEDESNTRKPFLIAQDVLAVLPEAVDTSNPDRFGLSYTDTIPLLVAAIKEQQAIIETLTNRITALEAK